MRGAPTIPSRFRLHASMKLSGGPGVALTFDRGRQGIGFPILGNRCDAALPRGSSGMIELRGRSAPPPSSFGVRLLRP